MSIKVRLLATLMVLSALLIAITATGWLFLSRSHDSISMVFLDRIVPLRDLKAVSDFYAVNVVDTAHKVRAGALAWGDGAASIEMARKGIAEHWKAYAETFLIDEEKRLVARVEPLMAQANATAMKLLDAMKTKDQGALEKLITAELYPAIDPVTKVLDELSSVQSRVAEEEYRRSQSDYGLVQRVMSIAAIASLAMIGFALWTTLARVVRPLTGMTSAMTLVAAGQLDTAVPALGRTDEVGKLAAALQTFKANGLERQRLLGAQAERDANAEAEKRRTMNALADDFEHSVGEVVRAVASTATQMQSSASAMAVAAEQTARQSTAVMGATEQVSANVQSVSSATEELSQSIVEIGRQVAQSATIGAQAVEDASRSNESVQGLAEAAQKIGQVVSLINDIASQTNLLALNATIEAARAGEAGKGFAVVASEVKILANQTSKATEEIATHVSAIQGATNETIKGIRDIGATIREMRNIATSISAAVEQQSAATAEIARNVQQTAAGTQDVSSNISGVAIAAASSGTAASNVLKEAENLSGRSTTLRAQVDGFLEKVRAA